MIYLKVPPGAKRKRYGESYPIQLSLVDLIVRVIIYEKYKVWNTFYETRTSKRSFSVLRR